jgi:hypothetical protein
LSDRAYFFPDLPPKTFHGLPGLLADSLHDLTFLPQLAA